MELFKRKVKQGSKTGRKIGYPTINFNVGNFVDYYQSGVYVCEIIINSKIYKGALYFGKKMHHKGNVLEIYILNFSHKIYGQFVQFKVSKKIRSPKSFSELSELKKQVGKDLRSIV